MLHVSHKECTIKNVYKQKTTDMYTRNLSSKRKDSHNIIHMYSSSFPFKYFQKRTFFLFFGGDKEACNLKCKMMVFTLGIKGVNLR